MGTVLVSRKPSTANSLSIFTKRKPTRGFGFNSSHLMAKTANRQQAVNNNKFPSYDLSQISMRPQAKLTVNQPGDAHTQEADKVAQQVVQHQQKSQQGEEEEEEEKLQTKSLANGITPVIQTKSSKKAKASKASGSKNDSKKVESPKESPKQKEKAPELESVKKPEADNGKAEDKKDAPEKGKDNNKKPQTDKSKAEDSKDAPEKGKDNNKKPQTDNKDYKDIVKKAGSWEKVKKRYLKDKKTMEGLIEFRKEEVGSIINEVRNSLKTDAQKLKDIAPGSTNLTSDYDVTFDAGGNESLEAKAVKEFNKLFSKSWGKESGIIFDTNVYTTGHMPTGEGKEEKEIDKAKTQSRMTQEGEKKSDKLLDEMSLLKIRRNMSQSQWKKYNKEMLKGIKDENTKKETEIRLNKVDQLHKESQKELKNKISKLTKQHNSFLKKLESKFKGQKDTEMAANNRIYEDYLKKVEENLDKLETLKEEVEKQTKVTKEQHKKLSELTLELQEMRSKALVFANEAYHTGGAVEHVVLNQQMGQGISMNKNEYLQSINEQTGFAVEQINDHKNMGMALWKSSKYVDRLCDAINNIHKNHKEEGFKLPEKQKEMSHLAKELLTIKKSKDEKLATDKQKSNAAKKLAKDNKFNSKDQYLKDILAMNTEVNQQIRDKKDDAKKPKKGGKESPQQQGESSNAASKRS